MSSTPLKKQSVFFIFLTITLDMIGVGLVIPTMPDIMKRFLSDPTEISNYYGYFISLYSLMQFVAAPLLGAISDSYGRRPVLLVSQLIAAFDYILMAVAPNLTLLFTGRILSGLSGANVTVAMAYIADTSDEKNRAANYGMMGAAFGIGFIIGPALGGIIGKYGAAYPFIVASGLNLLNMLYGLFVLPESLPKKSRRQLDFKKVNPLSGFNRFFNSVSGRTLLPWIFIYFCFVLAGQTHPSVWVLYTRHQFNWSTDQVGYSLAVVGVLSAVSQGFLTRIITPKIGEHAAVAMGCIGQMIAFSLFGFATQGWMLYAVLVLSAPLWVAGPALQSLISKSAPPNEQGELQGTLVSLTSIASILNPLIVTHLFGYFSNPNAPVYFPGAPYLFAGAVMGMAFLVFITRKAV